MVTLGITHCRKCMKNLGITEYGMCNICKKEVKTMKIIDLLNKIANGEDVPEKIKENNNIWIWSKERFRYELENQAWCILTFDTMELNDTVEIIEEDKPIEKFSDEDIEYHLSDNVHLYTLANKINEIINKINELSKKVEG